MLNKVVMQLRSLVQCRELACELGTGVEARYAKWLERHERELHGHPRGDDLSPFWSRLSVMSLKFAMLLQTAHDESPVITIETMESALTLTDFLKRALVHLFADEFAFTKEQQDRQKVLRKVTATSDGVSFRDILRATNVPKFELLRILDTLEAEERIRRERKGRTEMVFPVVETSVSSATVSRTTTDAVEPTFMRLN